MLEDFRRVLLEVASVQQAAEQHRIDYVPGCADLGDFDATSTTIALSPVQAETLLPAAMLQRTFERYWEFFCERRAGAPWEAFTPYEIRNIGAFVRLGWRDRAHELLGFFLANQRPQGWRQWPEVVWREERAPHFLGDLPHTWVGSDFIRSVLDMLAYEREADDALVLAGGVPAAWLKAPGITVRGLRTHYGVLDFEMREENGVMTARIGSGIRVPRGGIVLHPPPSRALARVRVDGHEVATRPDGTVIVRSIPAVIEMTAHMDD